MDKKDQLLLKKSRLAKLSESENNSKCPGVKRKLARQIRNIEK